MKLQSQPTVRFEVAELQAHAERTRPWLQRKLPYHWAAAGLVVGSLIAALIYVLK